MVDKCEKCLNSRPIISENGIHFACCLSAKDAIYCRLGFGAYFISTKEKKDG